MAPSLPPLYQSTVQLARGRRDSHTIHRSIEALAHGTRTLWAQPQPGLLILRTTLVVDWTQIQGAASAATVLCPTHYEAGQAVSWALVGNPTKSVHSGTGPDGKPTGRGKRTPLPAGQVPAWVQRKLAPGLIVSPDLETQLLAPSVGRGMTLTRWACTGTATVIDPDALEQLLYLGVGSGKAFGCGMLIVMQETLGAAG